MRPSRRLLLILFAVLLIGLGLQVILNDWRNHRFDRAALELAAAVKPAIETISSLVSEMASSGRVAPETETELNQALASLQSVLPQAQALPAASERLGAKRAWVGLIEGLGKQVPELIQQFKEVPPGPSPDKAMLMQNSLQAVQSWNSSLGELTEFSRSRLSSGGQE